MARLNQQDLDTILKYVQSQETKEKRVEALRAGSTGKSDCPLKRLLKAAYDADIEWLLPEGEVPFSASTNEAGTARLSRVARKLHYYVKGGYPKLQQKRRELLFIRALETVNKSSQDILIYAKDHRLHELYTRITPDVVQEAFPSLLNNPISTTKKKASTKGSSKSKKTTSTSTTTKTQGGENTKSKSTSNQSGSKANTQKKKKDPENYAVAADPQEIEQLDPNPIDEE